MTRDCMLWLNLPHVISQALMVIGVLVVAMWMHTGMIQQTDIERLCEYMTDDSWANWDGTDCLEASSCPYFCMCRRWDGSQWETRSNGKKPYAIDTNGDDDDGVPTWVARDRPAITRRDVYGYNVEGTNRQSIVRTIQEEGWTIDEWSHRKKYDVTFRTENVPAWPLSTMLSGKSLHVSTGVQIVPGYIAAGALPPQGPLLAEFLEFKNTAERLGDDNCMMEGLTLGRSVSFITAVMCEMLRAYTVRSLQPVYKVWNRTVVMHLACASSFLLTVSLTFIPGVKDLFALGTPNWFYYAIAFIFALGSMSIDEALKWVFRRVLEKREAGDKGAAERKQILDRVDMVVEKLQEADARSSATVIAINSIADVLEKDKGSNIVRVTI